MNDKNKRRLLKAVAAGGGAILAPRDWVSPVIQTVVLPVHAQTSVCFGTYAGFVDFIDDELDMFCYEGGNDCVTIIIEPGGQVLIELRQSNSEGDQVDHFVGQTTLQGTSINATIGLAQDSCQPDGDQLHVIATLTQECTIEGTLEHLEQEEESCMPTPFTISRDGQSCPPFTPDCED